MKTIRNSKVLGHVLFWLSIFAYFFITSSIVLFQDYVHLAESTVMIMIPQVIVTYILLGWLIPRYLNKKRYTAFGFYLFLTLVILFIGYVVARKFYFDVLYYDAYNELAKQYASLPLMDRFIDISMFFSKSVKFLTPAALIFTYRLYKNQQDLLQLSKQKREAELSALKNQLNPHFLFNTLNNLYALAVEKSDKTIEVIERLSEILDYILYRCADDYVSLQKEVELVENYLALEKIRYGNRVEISFENRIQTEAQLAPLILLTFLENAFKHGVSQELGVAKIDITLDQKDQRLLFNIINSKPASSERNDDNIGLGLANAEKQLGLLYGDAYQLDIQDGDDTFEVQLNLPLL